MRRLSLALAVALALVLGPAAAAEGLDAALRERLAQSVVQVQARDCQGAQGAERRVATGFAYGPAGHVVTAAHVIAGCGAVSVYWEKHGGQTQAATVVGVLSRADLALLHTGTAVGSPLEAEPQRPGVDVAVETLGYHLAVPTMSNERLRVTYGASRLADMLPPETRRELGQSGAIDLNLDILRLDGHLLPGDSGAPVFDMRGRVVGVGSGGLKSGAASVSWAVPAAHLEALVRAPEPPSAIGSVTTLFATASPAPAVGGAGSASGASATPPAVCGGVQFVYTGVRSFAELTVGHEDLTSVRQLMDEFDLDQDDTEEFLYHTFQPVDGGAAVAVPAWAPVHESGAICRATDETGRISVEFAGALVGSFWEAQAVSTQFENAFLYRSGRQWQPAPQYSYVGPYERGDGLTVNRKTAVGLSPYFVPSLAFETLLLFQPRGGRYATFTGVIGAYWDMDVAAINYCEAQPYLPACGPVLAEGERVAQMMLGVLLSTAPRI